MAGEFNLYSQYAQTQAPISQFVPETLPWELIYQVGANKQATQDKNKADILANSDLQVPAVYEFEKAYVKKRQEDLKKLVEESHGKDLTSGTEFYNFVNGLKEIKNDPTLATIKGNYDRVMDHYKQQSTLEKDAALTDWNLSVPRGTMEKYGAEGQIHDIGSLDITKGLNLHAKEESYSNDLAANGAESIHQLQDLKYKTGWKGITESQIGKQALRSVHDYSTSAEGKEALRMYDYLKKNDAGMTMFDGKSVKIADISKSEYLFNRLLNTAAEKLHMTTDQGDYTTVSNKLADRAYDKKEIEDGVIRQPGNLTQGVDFQGLDDLDAQIDKETDPSKKTTLQNIRSKAMADFAKSTSGQKYTNELNNKKTNASITYLQNVRKYINEDTKKWLTSKGINVDDFARTLSNQLREVSSSSSLESFQEEAVSNYLNKNNSYNKLNEHDKEQVLLFLNKANSIPMYNDTPGIKTEGTVLSQLYSAFDNYNSAFNESMAGKTFSVGDVLTHANPTIQEKTDKQFKQGYEVSDFSVIGLDSGSDEEKDILDAIHKSSSVTVKPVDNSETNTPEVEVTYDDPETKETITHRILAKDNRSVGLYHTMLKNYGDTGKNVSDRLQHASFVPPMGKAISLQDQGYSDVPKAYTAMTNKDGSTMTLYKDSKPVTFEKYIGTLTKDAAEASIKNEIWKNYGASKVGIFTSINDPKLEKIVNANSLSDLSSSKVNGVSEQDIYQTIMKQPYQFTASVDLYNTAKSLK